ncbi:hypothetical protein [Streptomyces sp. NPDC058280]|uniref:hypothetical protein n=1 Tax=Streptomyces sp. NPDC058280 TaxID=3346419 RepID=UPI0036EC09C7
MTRKRAAAAVPRWIVVILALFATVAAVCAVQSALLTGSPAAAHGPRTAPSAEQGQGLGSLVQRTRQVRGDADTRLPRRTSAESRERLGDPPPAAGPSAGWRAHGVGHPAHGVLPTGPRLPWAPAVVPRAVRTREAAEPAVPYALPGVRGPPGRAVPRPVP